ncbi:LacI family DNA-binding transcriptional regulator [Rugosimonospora acidiphila]|uniref:LacI family DNA-binding transcriptional regulator n=2 Tax=Rugosimonospora acidiphila TaxID=556531 RepID=A0ABP9SCA6_9ACTN
MRDVAARLGVSAMTVSRAIRGDSGIAEPTRQRVLAEVAALGYRPNDLARRLRSGLAHGLVGLVVTSLANPFYSQLSVGVEQVATERGAGLLVASANGDADRERELVEDMSARRIAGLIVVPAGNDHRHLDPRQLEGAPVVLAATPPRDIDVDCVLVDDFGGTYAACRRLIERGHRRIGFLGLPASLWTGSERYRGYAAALEDAGLPVDDRYVSRHRGDIELAEAATRHLIGLAEPPTALITANNRNTIGALRTMQHSPTPVALAGFDDIELADLLQLPLSVVAYDAAEVGREAARLLFDRIEETTTPQTAARPARTQRVVIPTRLVDYPRVPAP